MKKILSAALLSFCVGSAAAPPLSAAPALIPVNVATRGTVDDIVFMIARDKKYFEREGIDARFVPIRSGADASFAAMAAGVADVMRGTFVFSMNETIKKSGIKMVADIQHAEKGKVLSAYFLVRAGLTDKVKTYSDLKGLKVALPSIGSLGHLRFLRRLEEAGLKASDLDARNYPRNMSSLLMANKEIDLGYFVEPQASLLAATGMASVFAGSDVSDEDAPLAMLFYSARFTKNASAAQGFMNAYLRAVRDYNGMSGEDLAAYAGKAWGETVDKTVLKSMNLYPDGRIDAAYILAAQEEAVKRGLTSVKLSEKELFEMSFARRAAQLLDQEKERTEKK